MKKGYGKDLSGHYSRRLASDDERMELYYGTLVKICGNVGGLKILDVGCGGGNSSRILSKKGALVTGADASDEQIDIAKGLEREEELGIKYLPPICLQDMGLVEEGGFDIVTAVFVLHYASSREILLDMLTRIRDNLTVGGRLVALNSNPYNPLDPGTEHPLVVSKKWVDSFNEFGPYAEFLVTLHDKRGSALPPFSNYFVPFHEWDYVIKKVWGQDVSYKWHNTSPPEQASLAVLEVLN